MNFGDVFLMRFNKIIFILFLFSSSSHGLTWEESLKLEMDNSYQRLESKMESCKLKEKPLPKITDRWFIKLSKDEKYAAATYLEYLADKNCFGDNLKQYESDVFAYAAEINSKSIVQDWLNLTKVYRGDNFDSTFKKLDVSPLLIWSKKNQALLKPFDKVEFLEMYNEFQK